MDFKRFDPVEFEQRFNVEEKCLAYLAEEKWAGGYSCRHCGNTNYCKGKKEHSRRCTRCKREESPTAHTIFHGCRLPLVEAFSMAYTVCSVPRISSHELSRKFDTRQMTCWRFKKKIMECIESRGEFVIFDPSDFISESKK